MSTMPLPADIQDVLDSSARGIATEILHDQVRGLPHEAIDALIAVCNTRLQNRDYGRIDANRRAIAKLLVALLPRSLPTIRLYMLTRSDPYSCEIQFTLCCFLDDILQFTPPDAGTADAVLTLAKEYLGSVVSDDAYNAVMAADMLADHWEGDAGMEALLQIAEQPRYSVGKKAAIGALTDAVRRGTVSARLAPRINRLTVEVVSKMVLECRQYWHD